MPEKKERFIVLKRNTDIPVRASLRTECPCYINMNYSLKLINLIIVFFCCVNTYAQTGYGLRLGGNLSDYTVNVPDSIQISPAKKTGFQAGVFYNISSGGLFSMQPEVNFSQRGIRFDGPADISAVRNFNYLEFNILGKTTISGEKIKAYLNLGPGIAYLMSAQDKTDISGTTRVNLEAENIRRWDTAIHIGVGTAFRLGFENALFIEGRYTLGISDLLDIDADMQPEGYQPINHRVLGLTIGYIYYIDGFEIQ